MKISTKVSISIDSDLISVFKFMAADDVLPRILVGTTFLPRVNKTSDLVGKWDTPGSARKVTLKGGDTAKEELLAFIENEYFEYKVSEYTFFLKYFSKHAIGKWWFEEQNMNQTNLIWEYSFYPFNIVAVPVTWIFAKMLWKGYMNTAMISIKMQLEEMRQYGTLPK